MIFLTWYVGAAVTALCLALLLTSGMWRRWLSLTSLLSLVTAENAVLLAVYHLGLGFSVYSACYYAFGVSADIAQIWLLVDIALKLGKFTPRLRSLIRRGIWQLAGVFFLFYATLLCAPSLPVTHVWLWIGLHYEAAISAALMVTLGAILGAALLGHLQLLREARYVASGLFVQCVSSVACSTLSLWNPNSGAIAVLNACLSIIVGVLWIRPTDKDTLKRPLNRFCPVKRGPIPCI